MARERRQVRGEKIRRQVEKPAVVLDFLFERRLLFISISNISEEPVFKVRVEFDKPIRGIEGSKEVSSLPLFLRSSSSWPPRKRS